MSGEMLRAMDSVLMLSMLVKGTTPQGGVTEAIQGDRITCTGDQSAESSEMVGGITFGQTRRTCMIPTGVSYYARNRGIHTILYTSTNSSDIRNK